MFDKYSKNGRSEGVLEYSSNTNQQFKEKNIGTTSVSFKSTQFNFSFISFFCPFCLQIVWSI